MMNNVVMSIHGQISLQGFALDSFGYIPRNGIMDHMEFYI